MFRPFMTRFSLTLLVLFLHELGLDCLHLTPFCGFMPVNSNVQFVGLRGLEVQKLVLIIVINYVFVS